MVALSVAVLLLVGGVVTYLVSHRPPGPTPPPPEPLEGRTELVQGLAGETVLDSVNNLPHFDDTVWVLGSMSGPLAPVETYRYAVQYVPRLNRVRKILQQAAENRTEVVAGLKEKLSRSVEGFEGCYREMNEALSNSKTGISLDGPDEYFSRTVYAPAATYLLEQLDAFDALPVMRGVYAAKERVPVGRLLVFYAMHRLAVRHPREGLSAQAAKALDDYLTEARDLPAPQEVMAPAWNAAFEETDFRITVAGERIDLEGEPKVRLSIYPQSLADLEDFDGVPSAKVDAFFRKLCVFVDLAYPPGG